MFGWLDLLWWFLGRVSTAIWLALQFSPDLLQRVERNPWSGAVIAMVTLLGGGSLLLGQSAVLFLNRVSPRRFVLALTIGALQYLLALIGWGAVIWLVGTVLFTEIPALRVTIRLVGLGSAPYVFGVFVLIPYLGTLIGRLLATWSLLIVLNAMAFTFGVSYAAALVCIGLGWLVWLLLEATLGRPIIRVQRWLWTRFAGPYHDVPPQQRHAWLLARMANRPVRPNQPQ